MTPHRQLHSLQWGFLILGLLLLASWSKHDIASRGFQSAEEKKLQVALHETESARSEVLASDTASSGWSVRGPSKHVTKRAALGKGVLGRIEIPRLHITAIVAEGVDAKTLGRAVGHITSTAPPGGPGNCALAGHRDTFLRGLGGVRLNDVIRIVTLERTYTYQVEWMAVVEPQCVDVLDSTATRSLTLVTCYPFQFVGPAPQRFVVRARQDEEVEGSTAITDRGAFQPQGLTAERR